MYNFKSILLIINRPLETFQGFFFFIFVDSDFYREDWGIQFFSGLCMDPNILFFASIKPYNYFSFPFLSKYA